MSDLMVLGLGRNNFTSTLPTELAQLTALDTLGLEANRLVGTIPYEFGNMPSMLFMALDENRLTGRIPQELGDIDGLRTLSIGTNNFSGNVPWQICELGNLETFVADCFRNSCDCCTECTPTPAPVTQSPTERPSPSPTVCVPQIEFVADCIDIGQEIEVRFTNCNPRPDDWIGLYSKDADMTRLGPALLWSWACGDQSCNEAAKSGTVVFDASSIGPPDGTWPVERNDYYVYMIRRDSGGPYSAYAETSKMKIRDNQC
jgi:hypothetical protein